MSGLSGELEKKNRVYNINRHVKQDDSFWDISVVHFEDS